MNTFSSTGLWLAKIVAWYSSSFFRYTINFILSPPYRYAKAYSKAAIAGFPFSTIDDVIYLINLKYSGDMSKTALIEKNIRDKSTSMQIISRLLKKGMVVQKNNKNDKRSKMLSISPQAMQNG